MSTFEPGPVEDFDQVHQGADQGADQGAEIEDQGAHLDGFRVLDDDDQDTRPEFVAVGEDGEQIEGELVEREPMSRAAFHKVFVTAFALPGMIFPRWKPLAIQDDEQAAAKEASGAVYEILEIWWPSALIPGGDMAARVLAILPLALAKGAVVAAIRAEMKAERLEAAKQGAEPPANINRAPRGPAGAMSWMDEERVA